MTRVADRGDVGRAHGDQLALVRVALHRDDAAADRQVVLDQDEAAGDRVLPVLVQRQQALGAQHDLAGAVALDPLRPACDDRSEVSITRSIASTVTGASSVPSLSV